MVAEIQKPGYSFAEKRKVRWILSDPGRVRATTSVISTMLRLRRESPDAFTSWDAYTVAFPLPEELREARGLFQSAFERFRAARSAAIYFETQPQEEVNARVRSLFNIRPGASAQISFGVDFCMVIMPTEEIDRVSRYRKMQRGSAIPKNSTTIGFLANDTFLQTPDGNACPILFAPPDPEDGRSTQLHEKQHVVTNLYELRNIFFEREEPAETSVREQYKAEALAMLATLKKRTPTAISHTLERMLFRELANSRRSYFNEVASVVAEGESEDKEKTLLQVAENFEISSESFDGARLSYGKRIEQAIDGILDALEETDLPKAEKIKMTVQLETQLARAIWQNYQIGDSIDRLLGEPGKDQDLWYGRLYTAGPTKPEVLSWAIGENEDIHAVRRRLYRPQEDDAVDVMHQVIRRLLTRRLLQFPVNKVKAAQIQCVQEAQKDLHALFDPTPQDQSQYFEGQEFEKRVLALFSAERSSFITASSQLKAELLKDFAEYIAYAPSQGEYVDKLMLNAASHYLSMHRLTVSLYELQLRIYLVDRGYSPSDTDEICERFYRTSVTIRSGLNEQARQLLRKVKKSIN